VPTEPDEERELHLDDPDDVAWLADVLSRLATATRGWVNLLPEVEPGYEPPPRNPVIALFSSRGDAVPLATWAAPEATGGPASLGIQHGSGPQALARLGDAGLPLPDGWRKASDHPRRGLVVLVPSSAAPAAVGRWLLEAAGALSTVPLTGHWLAQVHRG
jgi:hypothetical protein